MTYFDYIFNMKWGVFKAPQKPCQASLFCYLFHVKLAMWAKKAPK